MARPSRSGTRLERRCGRCGQCGRAGASPRVDEHHGLARGVSPAPSALKTDPRGSPAQTVRHETVGRTDGSANTGAIHSTACVSGTASAGTLAVEPSFFFPEPSCPGDARRLSNSLQNTFLFGRTQPDAGLLLLGPKKSDGRPWNETGF